MNNFIIRKKLLIKESKLNELDKLESQVLKVCERICKGWDIVNVSLMPHINRGFAYLILDNYKSNNEYEDDFDLIYDEE